MAKVRNKKPWDFGMRIDGKRPSCAEAEAPAQGRGSAGASVRSANRPTSERVEHMSGLECLRELVRLAREAQFVNRKLMGRQEAIKYLGYEPKQREFVPGLKRVNQVVWVFHPETYLKRTFGE